MLTAEDRAERRRVSLARGAVAFGAEVEASGGPQRGVALLLMTLRPGADPVGAVRGFWDRYRKRFGRREYFAWLELTALGRVHYHAVVVDAPRHSKGALEECWGHGFVKVQWRGARWWKRRGVRYALSYAKKAGEKSYQQAYEGLGESLRTWTSSRLVTAAARLVRLPAWVKRTLAEAGVAAVDAVRQRGGWWVAVLDAGGGIVAVLASVEVRPDWETREYWPPGRMALRFSNARLEVIGA